MEWFCRRWFFWPRTLLFHVVVVVGPTSWTFGLWRKLIKRRFHKTINLIGGYQAISFVVSLVGVIDGTILRGNPVQYWAGDPFYYTSRIQYRLIRGIVFRFARRGFFKCLIMIAGHKLSIICLYSWEGSVGDPQRLKPNWGAF